MRGCRVEAQLRGGRCGYCHHGTLPSRQGPAAPRVGPGWVGPAGGRFAHARSPPRPASCLPACLSSSARPPVRPTRPGHLDIGNQLGEGKRRGPRYETHHVTATPDGAHSFSTQPRGSVSARSGSEAAQRALPALRLDTMARLPTLATRGSSQTATLGHAWQSLAKAQQVCRHRVRVEPRQSRGRHWQRGGPDTVPTPRDQVEMAAAIECLAAAGSGRLPRQVVSVSAKRMVEN